MVRGVFASVGRTKVEPFAAPTQLLLPTLARLESRALVCMCVGNPSARVSAPVIGPTGRVVCVCVPSDRSERDHNSRGVVAVLRVEESVGSLAPVNGVYQAEETSKGRGVVTLEAGREERRLCAKSKLQIWSVRRHPSSLPATSLV